MCLCVLFQAYDQPDIYETADPPECNQNTNFYEVMNQKPGLYWHHLMQTEANQHEFESGFCLLVTVYHIGGVKWLVFVSLYFICIYEVLCIPEF
jgi:hypothetical protein